MKYNIFTCCNKVPQEEKSFTMKALSYQNSKEFPKEERDFTKKTFHKGLKNSELFYYKSFQRKRRFYYESIS
jgi:hypothetical protein